MPTNFQNKFLIIISILHYFIQLRQCKGCEQKYCYKNETYVYDSEKLIAVESDVDDIWSINQYPSQLISKDFSIILNSKGKVISTTIIDSFDQNIKHQKILCKLSLENEQYFIQCTYGFANDQNQDILINEQNTYIFQPKFNLNCDNFFLHHNQSFAILCHTQTNLLIYLLDFKNITTLLVNYELSSQQIQSCKKYYFQFSNFQYVVAYYQCQDWTIIKIENDTIKTIFNPKAQNLFQQIPEFSELEDVVQCQQWIYLMFDKFYFKRNILKIELEFEIESVDYEIKQIVLNKQCKLSVLLKKQNLVFNLNTPSYKQFSIPQNQIKILKMEEYLLVQYEKTIFIRINSILNQTFSILQSTIYFIDQFNFLYQIDDEKNIINIYKLKFMKDYIQPTKKYLYLISTVFQFEIVVNYSCYQLTYLDQFNLTPNQIQIYTQDQTQQDCNEVKDIQILKDDLIIDESSSIYFLNYSHIQSIQDRQNFNSFCLSNEDNTSYLLYFKYSHYTQQHFYIQIQHESYLIYSKCNNLRTDQRFELRNIELVQYKDFIIFFKLHAKQLKLIYHNEQDVIQEEIQIYAHIVSYQQFNNYLLIFTDQEARPLIVKIEVLNLLIFNYINKDLYLELPIKFYHKKIQFELVQYPDFILVNFQNETLHFKMPERQIISIEYLIFNLFEITTVHVKNNSIEIFYFNKQELLPIYNYQMIGYKFLAPLKYVIQNKFLAIASVKENLTYIHIFSSIHNYTKLLDVIQIGRLIFFISDYHLYYYDSSNQLMIYDLKYFKIKLNPLTIFPFNSQNSLDINLFSNSQKLKNLTKKLTLQLTINQYCYQIQLRASKITINSKHLQNNLLNINKYFYGPINNLTIEDTSTFTMLGPFITKEIITTCNNPSMNKCIQELQISFHSTFLKLYFLKQQENLYLVNSNKLKNVQVLQLDTDIFIFEMDKNIIDIRLYQFDFENQKFFERISKQFLYKIENTSDQTCSQTSKFVKCYGLNFFIAQTDIHLLGQFFQNVVYVQGSQELYLEIQSINKWSGNEIAINLYTEVNGQFKLNQELLMNKNIIIEELQRIHLQKDFLFTNFRILSCTLVDNTIQIELLQNNHQNTLISILTFQLNQSKQKYRIKYLLRHIINDEIQNIEFYKKVIILKSYYKWYLFDLRENQIYNDYFSSFIFSSELQDQFDYLSYQVFNQNIKQIITIQDNNDLIFVKEDNQYYYGSIGYTIIGNSDKEEQFKLRATNDISSQTLLVTWQVENFIEQMLSVLGIMIIIIVVFIYFWRRNKLKNKNQDKNIHNLQM